MHLKIWLKCITLQLFCNVSPNLRRPAGNRLNEMTVLGRGMQHHPRWQISISVKIYSYSLGNLFVSQLKLFLAHILAPPTKTVTRSGLNKGSTVVMYYISINKLSQICCQIINKFSLNINQLNIWWHFRNYLKLALQDSLH